MKKPKISVALAACDGGEYIAEQLKSLLEQTVRPDEIVICDDSRDDSTRRALEPFLEQYPEIVRYEWNPEVLGVAKNFEKAVSLTAGDLIFLSDQDDVWLPEKLEKLSRALADRKGPAGAFCNSSLVDETLKPLGRSHWDLRGFGLRERAVFRRGDRRRQLECFCRRAPAAGHNMGFNAAAKKLLLPFPDLPNAHDNWIGLLLAAAGEWVMVEESLTAFRQHRNNLSQAGRKGPWREAVDSIRNDTFSWQVALFDRAISRLLSGSCSGLSPETVEILRDRRDHSAVRAAMNRRSWLRRLPLIWGETVNRRYFRYGRGWKSVIQDSFIRMFS